MNFHRFLALILLVTGICLVYVYQQTELFCLAYNNEKMALEYQDLLDKNNLLRYNVNTVTSLSSIGSKVLEAPDFEMPKVVGRVVKLEQPIPEKQLKNSILARALSVFSLKSQAEAKTINR